MNKTSRMRRPTKYELNRWQLLRVDRDYRQFYLGLKRKHLLGKVSTERHHEWKDAMTELREKFDLAFPVDFRVIEPDEIPFVRWNPLRVSWPALRGEKSARAVIEVDLRFKTQTLKEAFANFLSFERDIRSRLKSGEIETGTKFEPYNFPVGRTSTTKLIVGARIYELREFSKLKFTDIADLLERERPPKRAAVWSEDLVKEKYHAFKDEFERMRSGKLTR